MSQKVPKCFLKKVKKIINKFKFEPKQAHFTFAYSIFAQLSLNDQILAKFN